jgi:hypothetical protein
MLKDTAIRSLLSDGSLEFVSHGNLHELYRVDDTEKHPLVSGVTHSRVDRIVFVNR